MISSSTQTYRQAGWVKHKYWIVNAWRWLTGTRIPKLELVETPTTSTYPFPERLAQINSDIDDKMEAAKAKTNFIRRDTTVKRSSSATPSRTDTSSKSITVGGDDDGMYDEWRRRKALDAEETIPAYIMQYPITPSEAHNISGGDDSHVVFGGGSSDGGGASGSWGESHHDSGHTSYDSGSSSSSYDSGSSSDTSSYDSGSCDSGSSDSGSSD